VGVTKFDWRFWGAGRRSGDAVLRLFAQNERQLKRINRLKRIPNWALFLVTLISRCPGIPGTLAYLVAGWTRMRLSLFLVADLLRCLIFTLIWTLPPATRQTRVPAMPGQDPKRTRLNSNHV